MVIEASSNTSLTLPDNVTVIQGMLRPVHRLDSLAGTDNQVQSATRSTGTAWTWCCWRSPTRPSTRPAATRTSGSTTRRGGTWCCCRRAGTLRSRSSRTTRGCGCCTAILRGTHLLVGFSPCLLWTSLLLTMTGTKKGLGLQILERQGEIVKSLGGPGALAETERVCRNWRRYNAQHPVDQEDSGI